MAKTKTLISQLTERLYARIIKCKLEPGDILGTERALAADFGVSYGTIRESVGRLRALGILSGKPKVGLVVENPEPFDMFGQILPLIAADEENLLELRDFRIAIEMGALVLAMRKEDESVFTRMEETLEPFEKLQAEGQIVDADMYDIRFHTLLLKASGNRYLYSLHGVISEYFSRMLRKFPNLSMQSNPQRILDHRNLLAAIHSRQVADAMHILNAHLWGCWDSLNTQ